jgi:hypothetical protein
MMVLDSEIVGWRHCLLMGRSQNATESLKTWVLMELLQNLLKHRRLVAW